MGGALVVVVGAALFTGLPFAIAAFFGADSATVRFASSAAWVSRGWKLSWLIRLPVVVAVWLGTVVAITYAVAHWRLGWLALPVLAVIGTVASYRLSVFIGRLDFRSVPAATTA